MTDKKLIVKYKAYLKEHLSKKRYTHSINVADSACELAIRYGGDSDKAYLAGLVHDCAKELDNDILRRIVCASPLDVSEIEKNTPALFHAVAGAELIQTAFDIHDKEIIDAVRYHTVGCKDMSRLSQIVYLADLISADRDYKDVKKMRRFAEQDLDIAMYEALRFSVCDSVGKGNTIPVCTLEAYNDFALKMKQRR